MSDSQNPPFTQSPRKRARKEPDASNATSDKGKKQRKVSKKQQDINQASAAEEIMKMERALKKMKKNLKTSEMGKTSTRDDDGIDSFESEEEDIEPISSFRPEARHIDTTVSPSRRLVPASANRRALTSVTNSSTPNYHLDDEAEDEAEDLGIPTTATTTSPSPRTSPYYRAQSDTPPPPLAFNIRGQPADDIRTEPRQPEIATWKNGGPPANGSKPCASDYTDDVKRIILKACARYEVFLVTENVFPDHDVQSTKARAYFNEACNTVGTKYEMTDRIAGIIKARGSRIRGAIRGYARAKGDLVYGFLPQPTATKGVKKNKKLADELLEEDCFCWTRSLGRAYTEHFNPFPLPTLALIITSAVQIVFHIKQYQLNGVVSQQQFSEAATKELYDTYSRKVEEWANLDPEVTLKLRERSYRRAIHFAGASVTAVNGMSPEAKIRAQMALAGRTIDVDAEREDASDGSQEI
ncbi:hypothetical protein HWV62_34463 [Athelia sp. TMB]|nr:hypothetical protein HWV62_34463 [Athelia sp. TMB]